MLTEPLIDKKIIINSIQEYYGFEITSISFNKGGEASWGYVIKTNSGESYFCKIHTGLTQHEKRFELTYRLFSECGIKNITHPIKNIKGELVFYLDKYPTALFNFIPGANAYDKPLTEIERAALGKLLGQIHKAKEVIGDFAVKEDFRYGNIDRLLDTLDKSETFQHDRSEYKSKTAKLLLEKKEKILKRIKELKDLGGKLRAQNLTYVICHSEPHPWNTMVNNQGEVFLIDWDDCLFAPKEKDLNMIKDDPLKLKGYEDVVGKFEINQEVIHYYQMEWNISEIDAWSTSILYENSNEIQNQHYIEQFTKDLNEMDYC